MVWEQFTEGRKKKKKKKKAKKWRGRYRMPSLDVFDGMLLGWKTANTSAARKSPRDSMFVYYYLFLWRLCRTTCFEPALFLTSVFTTTSASHAK